MIIRNYEFWNQELRIGMSGDGVEDIYQFPRVALKISVANSSEIC